MRRWRAAGHRVRVKRRTQTYANLGTYDIWEAEWSIELLAEVIRDGRRLATRELECQIPSTLFAQPLDTTRSWGPVWVALIVRRCDLQTRGDKSLQTYALPVRKPLTRRKRVRVAWSTQYG
jgi:hypothetical protein